MNKSFKVQAYVETGATGVANMCLHPGENILPVLCVALDLWLPVHGYSAITLEPTSPLCDDIVKVTGSL